MTDLDQIKKDIESLIHTVNQSRQEMKNMAIMQESKDKIRDEKIDSMGKDVSRVIMLLDGDIKDPESGFIYRVKALEEFAKWVKAKKSYFLGGFSAVLFLIAFLGNLIMFIVKIWDLFHGK